MAGKDHVVELSEYLSEVLRIYGELPPVSEQFRKLATPSEFSKFAVEIQKYMDSLLREASLLPDSPGRAQCSASEIAALRAKFIPFDRSYKVARQLLQVAVPVSTIRRKRHQPLHVFVEFYLGQYDVFARYERLRSWLFRRTKKYEEWSKDYYASSAVQEARRQNRPSKEAERERKRRAYWLKKGFTTPPQRLPKMPHPQGLLDDGDSLQDTTPGVLQ